MNLLSETSTVDFCDGIGGHGTPDAGAGRGALGHGGDAVRRVLTGRGQGRVAGHTQAIFCKKKKKIKVRQWTVIFCCNM